MLPHWHVSASGPCMRQQLLVADHNESDLYPRWILAVTRTADSVPMPLGSYQPRKTHSLFPEETLTLPVDKVLGLPHSLTQLLQTSISHARQTRTIFSDEQPKQKSQMSVLEANRSGGGDVIMCPLQQ